MSDDPLIGRLLGDRYRPTLRLGVGGMGIVYLAEQKQLDRAVVVKIMRGDVALDPDAAPRFENEARLVAQLTHPNIVTVHDFGVTEDGLLYLVMEHVDGRTLRQVLVDEGPSVRRAVSVLRGVALALCEAHRRGVIHRDLKPENIMVLKRAGRRPSEDAPLKVLDFGLGKMIGTGDDAATVTASSVLLGTAGYLSPEIIDGAPPSPASDLYALGVIAFELITGANPFNSPRGVGRTLIQHLEHTPAPPSCVAPLAELVVALVAKDPAARPASAEVLLDILEELPEDLLGEALSTSRRLRSGPLAPVVDNNTTRPIATVASPENIQPPDTPDAGLPDAGLPDAELPDAGLPGAGLPDAGLPGAALQGTAGPDGRPSGPVAFAVGLVVLLGLGAALAWAPDPPITDAPAALLATVTVPAVREDVLRVRFLRQRCLEEVKCAKPWLAQGQTLFVEGAGKADTDALQDWLGELRGCAARCADETGATWPNP